MFEVCARSGELGSLVVADEKNRCHLERIGVYT